VEWHLGEGSRAEGLRSSNMAGERLEMGFWLGFEFCWEVAANGTRTEEAS